MIDPRIGQFVARFVVHQGQVGRQLTKAHLVESVIAGREITRCGRQFADRRGTVVAVVIAVDACEQCVPQPATPGDEPMVE